MENIKYIRGNKDHAKDIKRYFEIQKCEDYLLYGYDDKDYIYFSFLGVVTYLPDHNKVAISIIEECEEIPISKVLEVVNSPKYDFKPFDKVLVRDKTHDEKSECDDDDDIDAKHIWRIELFSRIIECHNYQYMCLGTVYKYCIPYEGNEHLLGTDKDPE